MNARLLAAAALLVASLGLPAATDDPFVVHEWGTFTTVQAADGEQLWWTPPASVDVPDFVHRAAVGADGQPASFIPKDRSALVRMETPVIYFYSQRERVADVRVLFRGGNLTEWYPQATHVTAQPTPNTVAAAHTRQFLIEWAGVKILARDTREISLDKLIRTKAAGEADHYYIARETDANFLRVVTQGTRVEHERDLFYRGLGYFEAPLAVGMDADEQRATMYAREAERIDGAFLLTIRQGMMRYQKLGAISSAASTVELNAQPFGALGDVRQRAMREMEAALVQRGLYEKEARAMVNTWQDQWFAEEGTRILYFLPRNWTTRTLPLMISPQPDSVVRVMVGRAEIIPPAAEQEIREQILTFRTGDPEAKAGAAAAIRELRLGRFLGAAFTKVTQGEADQAVVKSAWELAEVASAREDARSARN